MKVLIIAQYFPPDFGGASTRAYNAAQGLLRNGCDVTVVTAFPHYPHGQIPAKYKRKLIFDESIDGIRVIRTYIPGIPHSTVYNRLRLHLAFSISCMLAISRIRKVDAIFAMNPNLFSFFPAWIYSILFNREIIRNVDDLWPEVFYEMGIVKSSILKRILNFAAKLSYRIPAAVIPVSKGYVETISTKYGISENNIFVIEHGVDTALFRPRARNDRQTIERKSSKKIIMYSGALNVGYDFRIVIEAAKLLADHPIHFIIRGTGDLDSTIASMIENNKLTNIDLRTNLLSKEELVSLLNEVDIFLLPMNAKLGGVIDKGMPTKILEYQALGKPIICVSNGEPARYIENTHTGLVVRSTESSELAKAILNLVYNDGLSAEMGTKGLKNVQNNLTLEIIGRRLLHVIHATTGR